MNEVTNATLVDESAFRIPSKEKHQRNSFLHTNRRQQRHRLRTWNAGTFSIMQNKVLSAKP